MNQSFFDSAILARTATVSAVSPEVSLEPTFTVRWDNAQASPDATIRWYDVQWMDRGRWAVGGLADLDGADAGYIHGAAGAHVPLSGSCLADGIPTAPISTVRMSPRKATATTIAAPQLVGEVRGNGAYAFAGTRVSIVDTGFETVSRQDGSYQMWTEPMDDPHAVTISNPPWLSPEPVYGVTFGPIETVALDVDSAAAGRRGGERRIRGRSERLGHRF